MSSVFTQFLGDTVQTGTGKVDPARKFKCTTAARGLQFSIKLLNTLRRRCTKGTKANHQIKPLDRYGNRYFGWHLSFILYGQPYTMHLHKVIRDSHDLS